MKKRFAIFDFDGTLVDSMPYWQQEERDFLVNRGVSDPETVDKVLERIKPLNIMEASQIMVDWFQFPDKPEEVGAGFVAHMSVRYRESIPAKDGARAYVDALRRDGVRMAVASGTDTELMEVCLQRLGLRDCFEFLLSCLEVGAGKDRPDIYLEAARRFGASPGEIAVYEDSAVAMRTAKDAGFYGVGVYDPPSAGHWDELQALADVSVKDWDEALKVLT
ncbi:MAG: HAD family phosphatase [Oscillospiraceae bacterium]|nr:HAD family phosphatase [Oscillospiraceae bacterium]